MPGRGAWYVLAVVLALGLIQSFVAQPAGKPLTYSEFKQAIRAGQVAEVTVSEQSIAGTFTQAREGGSRFSTTPLVVDFVLKTAFLGIVTLFVSLCCSAIIYRVGGEINF